MPASDPLVVGESSWLYLPHATDEQAELLQQLGRALASDTPYWDEELDAPLEGDVLPRARRSAIRVERQRDGIRIQVPNRVGILAVDGIRVRVVPKLTPSHVIHLLRAATGLERALTSAETRVLADGQSGFWEILARAYVFEAERLLRSDPIREYERRVEDLPFVRGSLVLAPTARAFYSGRLRFRSRFHQLSVDTPLNRIIRAALLRVASNPLTAPDTRLAATRLRAWLDDVGDLRSTDRSTQLDRRTSHYRFARELADDVLDGSVRGWDSNGHTAMAFLIQTPLLVQRGVEAVLNRHLKPDSYVRARKVHLHGTAGATVNPDLVFGAEQDSLADVKYRMARPRWNRSEVYEVVSFGRHLGCRRVALVDFSDVAMRRPMLGFGDVVASTTWVSHVPWPLNEDDPARAEVRFVQAIRTWLKSGGLGSGAGMRG